MAETSNFPDGYADVKEGERSKKKYWKVGLKAATLVDAAKVMCKDNKERYFLTISRNESYDPSKKGSHEYNVYVNLPKEGGGQQQQSQASNDRSDETPF